MKITLTLDDDLSGFYEEEAKERKCELAAVLEDRLKRAGQLDSRTRYVIVSDRTRDQLENILGGGHLKSAEDLLNKVGRLARIKFGDHEIRLSAGQFEELKWRAQKQGKTIEQLLLEIWQRLQDQFFNAIP